MYIKMKVRIGFAIVSLVGLGLAASQTQEDGGRNPVQRTRPTSDVSRSGPGGGQPGASGQAAIFPLEYRTIDGVGNNQTHPEWGAAGTAFMRMMGSDYGDGAHSPAGANRPSAREISNVVSAQSASMPNTDATSDYLWMWGQFLDHDVTETPVASPSQPMDIAVPMADAWFDPNGTGSVTIPLDRSAYDVVLGVRQQVNLITAYIDASNVYGSDPLRANELRTLDGTGRLKTSPGDLLPYNVNGFPNAMGSDPSFFLAGDIRANEHVALTAMHTLFVREHNYWAKRLVSLGMTDGEQIYQSVRALVAAEMQAITYREFLPALLGRGAMAPYSGYNPAVDASIANEFAAAGFRVGHTMLSPKLLRIMRDGSTYSGGDLPLSSAFFNVSELTAVGIDPYLRGLSKQRSQQIDGQVIDEVRNFLFGPPGAGGFDLASLNIQRGRDHGLPCYNDLRQAMGLPKAQSFADVSMDPAVQARLSQTYVNVDAVDAWIGLLSEDHAPGASVGPTLRMLLADQFLRLRDGDRFWYEAYMPPMMIGFVEKQTLAQIIRRNTGIDAELSDDVFHTK